VRKAGVGLPCARQALLRVLPRERRRKEAGLTPREQRAALWGARQAVLAETLAAVAKEYGITVESIDSDSRVPPMGEARREVMTRLWERGLSLSEIGRLLGRHPSTVHAAVRKSMGDTYSEISPGPGRVRLMPEETASK